MLHRDDAAAGREMVEPDDAVIEPDNCPQQEQHALATRSRPKRIAARRGASRNGSPSVPISPVHVKKATLKTRLWPSSSLGLAR